MERLNEDLTTDNDERNDESNVSLNGQEVLQGLGDDTQLQDVPP